MTEYKDNFTLEEIFKNFKIHSFSNVTSCRIWQGSNQELFFFFLIKTNVKQIIFLKDQ